MAYVDDLIVIRDSLVTEMKNEAVYRAAHGPKPTYSIGGKSVQWDSYLSGMQNLIKSYSELINAENLANSEQFYRGYC